MKHRLFNAIIAVLLTFALLPGCAIQRTVVRSTMDPILVGGLEAMMAETNLDIAKAALASNLKLVEGMLRNDPNNTTLLLFAAQGYTAYALAFVEDLDQIEARHLYQRAANYANRWLVEKENVDLLAISDLSTFKKTVENLDDDAIGGIFWLGNSWGSQILNGLDDIILVSQLPYVEILMQRSLEIDETFFYGFAHLFFGGYFGARPPILGGDTTKAVFHLEKQIELTDGNLLFGHLFMVKYVHLRQLNESSSRSTLKQILEFDLFDAPEDTRLLNRVAQAKAELMLDNLDQLL
jgi:hypothetical protein